MERGSDPATARTGRRTPVDVFWFVGMYGTNKLAISAFILEIPFRRFAELRSRPSMLMDLATPALRQGRRMYLYP